MKRVKELLDKYLPTVWGYLMLVIITVGLVGLLMWVVRWTWDIGGRLI